MRNILFILKDMQHAVSRVSSYSIDAYRNRRTLPMRGKRVFDSLHLYCEREESRDIMEQININSSGAIIFFTLKKHAITCNMRSEMVERFRWEIQKCSNFYSCNCRAGELREIKNKIKE